MKQKYITVRDGSTRMLHPAIAKVLIKRGVIRDYETAALTVESEAEAAQLAAEQAEAERIAAEESARAEADRLAAEEAARVEAERLGVEKAQTAAEADTTKEADVIMTTEAKKPAAKPRAKKAPAKTAEAPRARRTYQRRDMKAE